MASSRAVLIDLDQTLVITKAIQPLRDQGQWRRIAQSFHLTSLPPETTPFLHHAQALASLGVITSSPRRYAEHLLAYHQLNIPVIVAYHDTQSHKPHPAPLLEAARRLHVPVEQCFYIGDESKDILAAVQAWMLPIGLCWDGSLPRQPEAQQALALCCSWEEVLNVLRNRIQQEGTLS